MVTVETLARLMIDRHPHIMSRDEIALALLRERLPPSIIAECLDDVQKFIAQRNKPLDGNVSVA